MERTESEVIPVSSQAGHDRGLTLRCVPDLISLRLDDAPFVRGDVVDERARVGRRDGRGVLVLPAPLVELVSVCRRPERANCEDETLSVWVREGRGRETDERRREGTSSCRCLSARA